MGKPLFKGGYLVIGDKHHQNLCFDYQLTVIVI